MTKIHDVGKKPFTIILQEVEYWFWNIFYGTADA